MDPGNSNLTLTDSLELTFRDGIDRGKHIWTLSARRFEASQSSMKSSTFNLDDRLFGGGKERNRFIVPNTPVKS